MAGPYIKLQRRYQPGTEPRVICHSHGYISAGRYAISGPLL